MNKLKPFVRTMYWDEELKALWEPRINRIRKTFNIAEHVTVMVDMRDVYVYHIKSTNFEESYAFLRKNDMVFFPIKKTANYSGFSHRHIRPEKGKPYIIYGAAVKRGNEEAGELFKKYSLEPDHVGQGRQLGYPKPDIDFFEKEWGKTSIDLVYESALETPGRDIDKDGTITLNCHPLCNNMLRYFGVRISPQITRNMNNDESISWGTEWFDIMSQIDEEATTWALELLSMPNTWNCYKGVAIIDTPIFRGVTNSDTTEVRKVVINQGWNPGEES